MTMNPQQWDIQLCRLLNSPSFAGLHAPKTLIGSATDEMRNHVPTCRQTLLFVLQDILVKNPLTKLKQNYSPKQKTQGVFPFLHLLVTTMPMASRICQKINQLDCYSLRAGTKPVVSTASKKRCAVQLGKKVFLLYKLFYSDLFTFQIKKKKKLRTQKRTNN